MCRIFRSAKFFSLPILTVASLLFATTSHAGDYCVEIASAGDSGVESVGVRFHYSFRLISDGQQMRGTHSVAGNGGTKDDVRANANFTSLDVRYAAATLCMDMPSLAKKLVGYFAENQPSSRIREWIASDPEAYVELSHFRAKLKYKKLREVEFDPPKIINCPQTNNLVNDTRVLVLHTAADGTSGPFCLRTTH